MSHSSPFRLCEVAVQRAAELPAALLVPLLQQLRQRKALGRAARPVIAKQAQCRLQLGQHRAAPGVGDDRASARNCSTLTTLASGAHCLVFLLTMNAVPMPQSGWQPHLSVPHSAPGPCNRSVTSEMALDADSGNQSRSGSVTPVCVLTSWARCDSV